VNHHGTTLHRLIFGRLKSAIEREYLQLIGRSIHSSGALGFPSVASVSELSNPSGHASTIAQAAVIVAAAH
jgi:hypothetical protein